MLRWYKLELQNNGEYIVLADLKDIAKAEKKKVQKGPGVGGDAWLDNQGKVIRSLVN